MSIKAKFTIPTTITIIVVAMFILATSVFTFSGYIYVSMIDETEAAVEMTNSFIEELKVSTLASAKIFAQDENIINALENGGVESALDAITAYMDAELEFVTLTDGKGIVLSHANGPEEAGSSALSRASIKAALEDGHSLSFLESDSKIRLSVQGGSPIHNARGVLIGAISVGVRMDSNRVVEDFKTQTGCETAFLINNETVATTTANETAASEEIYETVMFGDTHSGMTGSLNEKNVTLSNYSPLDVEQANVNVMMYVGMDVNEVLSVILLFIGLSLLITVIMLLISVRVISLIVQRIVTPIKDMTAAASALAIGDTELVIDVRTKDEMKTLADAFNSIIVNTRHQIETVQNIASGVLDTRILPRSEKDEMNIALDKLNITLWKQAEAIQEDLQEQKKMIAEIELQDSMMHEVNQIADLLLQSRPEKFDDTLQNCMSMMTGIIDADRMYIWKNHEDGGKLYCTQIYEWCEDVQSFNGSDLTVNLSFDDAAPETRRILEEGGCVHSLVRDLPDSDREQYAAQGILALMLIPVFIHNEFWGFVGFDNCRAERLFTESEQSIVRSGSMLIANALLRNEYVQNIHDASVELEKALDEAEKANSAKGDFLASMSHEMRTPLNAIIGLSEIALDDASLNEEAASNLEKIHNSGSTLLSIVNDILDVSKIQSGKFEILPEKYEVPSMVNDAVIQNAMRIGSRPISFKLFIDKNMPSHLIGDELRIKQIINNLLSNAIKYTEEGSVTLDIGTERDGDSVWLTISVEDSGVGIKPGQLKKLFTDFVQLGATSKQQAGGTGLGLSITKSLTEMMGGTINVESVYGEGSTFSVRLKQGYVSDEVIGEETARNISSFQYSVNKMTRENRNNRIQLPYARVLVVDDNTTNLDVAKGLLKPYGMKVDCVNSGFDAVNLIMEGAVKYNAVFMDHMMPEMNGIQAARIIRGRIKTDYARNIPLIALTANAIAGSEEMFLREGFQGFISKPIDVKKLDAVIHRWVRDKNLEDKYANAYREQESQTNPPDLKDSLWNSIEVEGIDIAGALKNFSGDDDILSVILRSYVTTSGQVMDKLDGYLSSGDEENYTIAVHGIKGTSYSVFANEAGQAAEELEKLAKAGNFDTVKEKHPAFKEIMEPLLSGLTKALEMTDAAKNKPAGLKPPEAKPPAEKKGRRFDFVAPGARVLVADDNETNLTVALGLLKPLGMTIETAENGQKALNMIKEHKYHIIFIDHLMPVMDGIEAVKQLRALDDEYCKNVPVIALSANNSPKVRAEFIEAGMNDFTAKPIDTQDIQQKLKRWLPEELIKEPESGSEQDARGEAETEEHKAPLIIEGIDTDEGIRYSGSRELFTDLLGNFYKLIDIKANKIEKCLADGLIRDVTIEVHALKSTARMIGAGALSKEFERMEDYGNEENVEALERELPSVLEHYRRYKPILKSYGEANESAKRQADKGEIVSLLKQIQTRMDGFDLDGADEALKKLDELLLPEEIRSKMETLRALVADVAMEDVIALTQEIINTL